jgi:hypothetical protein
MQSDTTTLLPLTSKPHNVKLFYIIIGLLSAISVVLLLTSIVLGGVLISRQDKNITSIPFTCAADDGSAPNKYQMLSDEFQAQMHKEIRQNVIQALKSRISANNAVIFVQGTQQEEARQDRNFLYLTGNFWYGYEVLIQVNTGHYTLLAPRIPQREAIWNLPYIPTLEQIQQKFGANQVVYKDNRTQIMQNYNPDLVLTLNYQNPPFDTPYNIDNTTLTKYVHVSMRIYSLVY